MAVTTRAKPLLPLAEGMKSSYQKKLRENRLKGPDSPISCGRAKILLHGDDLPISSSNYGIFPEEILNWIDAQPASFLPTEQEYKEIYEVLNFLKPKSSPQRKVKRQERSEIIAARRMRFDNNRDQLMLAMLHSGMAYICAHPQCGEMRKLHVDHRIPLSKGGTDDLHNLQFLCLKHNLEKGVKYPH